MLVIPAAERKKAIRFAKGDLRQQARAPLYRICNDMHSVFRYPPLYARLLESAPMFSLEPHTTSMTMGLCHGLNSNTGSTCTKLSI
jgi:hypothetical protein